MWVDTRRGICKGHPVMQSSILRREPYRLFFPLGLVLAAACLLGAASTRAVLEDFGPRCLDAMVVAAGLWLVAVAARSAFLLPYLRRRRS